MKDTLLSRRTFIRGLAAGSLALGFQSSGPWGLTKLEAKGDTAPEFEPDVFLKIAPDGLVTIVAHRSEMGTGIRTALPTVVADELGADWERVRIAQAIGDKRFGSQNTDGSRSVRRFYERMQVAGATARTMLERAAAKKWGVDAAECTAREHSIVHAKTGRRLDFKEVVEAAAALEVPSKDELKMRPASEYRYVGKDVPLVDLDDIVTGRAVYGLDVRADGMLYAVVARSPVLGAPVKSYDREAAKSVPGVVDLVEIAPFTPPHHFQALGGVGVLATSTHAAIKGRQALKTTWGESKHGSYDSKSFEKELIESSRSPGLVYRSVGDVDGALDSASDGSVFEADYYVPHLAHAPMEPPCALAHTRKDGCEVWAPIQNPQAAQTAVAKALGLEESAVVVHVTLLGGGFGRKSKPDFIVEAALLSRAAQRPVHVTWTREDDIQNGYLHTVAAVHMRAAVDDRGRPTAWLQRSAFPTIGSTFDTSARNGNPLEMGLGFTCVPYDVPNLRVENGAVDAHVRIGWLRSVAHIYHAFAICSFPDELAHRAGRDPLDYLMELLGKSRNLDLEGVDYPNHHESLQRYPFDVGRLRDVTQRVAAQADWRKRSGKLPRGRGLGIACHRSFLSYVAHVVEVEVTQAGTVKIPRVHVAVDAGRVIHPDMARSQLEGAAIFSAALALHGEVTASNGRIDQSNFDDYKMTRMDDAPREVSVDLVQSDASPGGIGEVGVPSFAPALCNAIFAATGKRIRRLPLARHDLSWE